MAHPMVDPATYPNPHHVNRHIRPRLASLVRT
jgi:hypothetical protein